MRILQLIDSLDAGGAERMAVNYANVLSEKIEFSALAVTRKEGFLKDQLQLGVGYVFLQKKSAFDIAALRSLIRYIKVNKIEYVHAHSTSVFFAFLARVLFPKFKIIWHDHYGKSEFLAQRKQWHLKLISPFLHGIISVNEKLEQWAKEHLGFKKTLFLRNFSSSAPVIKEKLTPLKGQQGTRIVCLANLRPQKGHFFLLDIAGKIRESQPNWTFHLVGKDFNDPYSDNIRASIQEKGLSDNVYVYGSCKDVEAILSQCDIGILTSSSEGLPVALLEYATAGLPVVLTNVGEIPAIIRESQNGFLTPYNDQEQFAEKLLLLTADENLRKQIGAQLQRDVLREFSSKAIVSDYIAWLNEK